MPELVKIQRAAQYQLCNLGIMLVVLAALSFLGFFSLQSKQVPACGEEGEICERGAPGQRAEGSTGRGQNIIMAHLINAYL
jgi:hypothetical protein